jgi:SH3-like domain-containing protein
MMWLLSPRVRHAFAFLLPAVVLLLLACSSAERAWAVDGERTYRVVAVEDDDVLNIRAGPSAGHPVIGEIPPSGRGLRLTGPCRSWCPISYNGASGWVHARYLAIEPAVAPFIERLPAPARPAEPAPLPRRLSQAYWRVTGVAVADGLRVHGEPSLDAPVVHVFEAQSGCIRLAGSCQKPWCQVRFPTGGGERIGWVNSKYLSPSGGPCGR